VFVAAQESQEEEMHKKIEEDVMARLITEFNSQWAQKEAALKNELATEKAARKTKRKKDQSKFDKIWSFIRSQQVGSSTAPSDTSLSQNPANEDKDEDDTTNLSDDSDA